MPSKSHCTARLPGWSRYILAAVCLLCWSSARGADSMTINDPSGEVITNIMSIWTIPVETRSYLHRLKTELGLYYVDPQWNVAFGECAGMPTYLNLSDCPVQLAAGDRVSLDGFILPAREHIEWERTSLRIVGRGIEFASVTVPNLVDMAPEIRSRLIVVEGLVDHLTEDSTHVTMNFVVGSANAAVFVMKGGTNGAPLPFKEGDMVRLRCVYAPEVDRDGKLTAVNLWVPSLADVKVIGSLDTDPRFDAPVGGTTSINDGTPRDLMVHVRGVVRNHEAGKWLTVWDAAGQVIVQCKQTLTLRHGETVDVIGHPFVLGVQQCLREGLYRPSYASNKFELSDIPESAPLKLAEQVRDLSREQAARHREVKLRGVVTWVHDQTPFAYIEDASSGIRVMNPKWVGVDANKVGALVEVQGEVAEGDFVPVLTNAVLTRSGYWIVEEGRPITLEEALTGVEDGRWVGMRGYVRNVKTENGFTHLELSTSSGEFEAITPESSTFDSLKGSIIRIQGVCSMTSNSRHQLTGVQIWVPERRFIVVEEPAPDDFFEAPLRSPGNLRRFSLENSLTQRVRTSGTVVMHVPGRYLYVQDGNDSVFALSQQTNALQPGDRVEVVGFPGNRGQRFLLREAVYRRISSGTEPTPMVLPSVHTVNLDLEGILATAEGTVLNLVEKDGQSRVLVQSGDSTFEASLDLADGDRLDEEQALRIGSRVAVTGVYEVQNDESGKSRAFLLRLRTWGDVRVLALPPWWTLARLGWALFAVIAVSLIALSWGALISRKNALLRHAQAELQSANDRLEQRVEERTSELREQVAAKERARTELARAQERLILTSRQAGMAEVATGVLHNVGNVLNSVNVSAALLAERLRNCRVESVGKTAALLQQEPERLAQFLTDDPRGKTLPGYLEKLNGVLARDKKEMLDEVESLTKNIDHIKVIVAMQQSYAKVGGVLEDVDPRELIEDAIQINAASLERHKIQVVREFGAAPAVSVDRHKVLQILVNLISNAKHALREKNSGALLTIGIQPAGLRRVRLTVADNGMGIAPENLSRIFSQGFTTRKDGHGFGLHSGANAARELGGALSVKSDGVGCGATFVLELPAAGTSVPGNSGDKGHSDPLAVGGMS